MQNSNFRNALVTAIIALYTTEFITLSVLTISLFHLCLLSFALLLTLFILLNALVACECFDELFGLKGFVRQKHYHLLTLKLLLATTVVGAVSIDYLLHPNSSPVHLTGELWLVLLSEALTYVLVQLKMHIGRLKR
ncbi:hypothetical protein [Spirosoma panaciterrae]|uniref:hypothetical protein n=1 Tax=Spirosoma panaciterrae TaxID=496058 RepID=UPI00036693B0|nr:hypothetical protein [Spirosoma panaciterrae]